MNRIKEIIDGFEFGGLDEERILNNLAYMDELITASYESGEINEIEAEYLAEKVSTLNDIVEEGEY